MTIAQLDTIILSAEAIAAILLLGYAALETFRRPGSPG